MTDAQAARNRVLILKAFSKYSLKTIRPDALAFLEELIVEYDIDEEEIPTTMELLAKNYLLQDEQMGFVTKSALMKVYEAMKDQGDKEIDQFDAETDVDNHIFFVNAFEMPWWQYSLERQTFEKSSRKPTISGTPESRARMYRDRLQIIRQIILRNEHFAPAAFQMRETDQALKLRSTKDLLGRGGDNERFMLFGMLAYSPEGKLCLEDLDGRVELDLSRLEVVQGLYTEGCLVMIDGQYTEEETFVAVAMGHPPCEKRKQSREIDGHFDFLGKGATTLAEDAAWTSRMPDFEHVAVIVISDLWLDEPRVLGAMRQLLEKCIAMAWMPKVFILCGNFTSKALQGSGKDLQRYQDGFDDLADIISSYPDFRETHFVFVPGPLDKCGSTVFPRPPILSTYVKRLKARVPKAHFMSNPCRIKIFAQEIVIFREDMMAKILRNLILHKEEGQTEDLSKYLFQTVLDQSHLCPLPQSVQPILSEFDHTMRLYPLPTTLILADKYQRYEQNYEGCHVINPGSFSGKSFGFSTYFPHNVSTEASELADD